jgi:hypothetical protein
MRRTVRTVTTLLLVGIILGIGFAVLYFGTSTGLISGGQSTVMGGATKSLPFYAQVGWLRNTAPWPVTIESVTTDAAHTTAPTQVFIETQRDSKSYPSGTVPDWTKVASRTPYQLAGGSLRYLGFAVAPASGHIASFSSFTVTFVGPLGITFHKTFTGTQVAARAAGLPTSILAPDPSVDNTSLDSYVVLLRTAIEKKDLAALAVVMGGNATTADARALLTKEKGFTSKYLQKAVPVTLGDPSAETLRFYRTSVAKDALPPLKVVWAGFRWSTTP